METEVHSTPIQSFYAGQSIFITGGTGFMGKILVEKLLRSCPDISMIYLLIRPKEDKSPDRRLDEIFDKSLYDRIKKEVPKFRKKIVPIVGDLDSEDFGLSENDRNVLIHKVSIIFHVAANIRFVEKIKSSVIMNVYATNTVLKLAKLMPNLKSLIHVSTAYSNCYMKHIEERFYSYPINHKDLITLIRNSSENVINEKISRIISNWPNIYTFTKAMAEDLIRDESKDLPVGIFRPAQVLSSANEPFVGWIENQHGLTDLIISSLLGITRFYCYNPNAKANLVPVDYTINALITSAWDVSNQHRRGKNMMIYNFVSPVDGPTWNEYIHVIFETNKIYPLHKAIYFPLMVYFQRKIPYRICVWLGHFLPALLVDATNICINRSPRMWKSCMKIDKLSKILEPFGNNEWSFCNDNVQALWDHLSDEDQQLFKFNMVGFDWMNYLIDHYKGIRLYLLNEDDSTLEISRIKYKRFYWLHQTFKSAFIFAILWFSLKYSTCVFRNRCS